MAHPTYKDAGGNTRSRKAQGNVGNDADPDVTSVVVDSSALPTGAATATKQDTIIGHVDGIEGLLTTIDADTGSILTSAQSIDGKITACNTGAVVISSGTVTTVSTVTNLAQMAGAAIAMGTGTRSAGTQRVTIATDDVVPVTGTFWQATQPVSFTGSTDVATQTTLASALTALQIMDDWDNAASDGASVSGDVAHDTADAGEPVKVGAKATTSLSGLTLVADADRTNLFAGIDGVQITRPHCNLEDITSGQAAITDGSSTSVISAQGAGVKTYITSVIIANTSATAVTVDLRDGTGGSVKATLPVPANTSGVVCNLPVPLPFSANTAVAADPSAAASTITVTLIGFKSKV